MATIRDDGIGDGVGTDDDDVDGGEVPGDDDVATAVTRSESELAGLEWATRTVLYPWSYWAYWASLQLP